MIRYDDPSLRVTEVSLEREFELPPGMLAAVRTKGEQSHSNAVSPKGARGIYQFMPATWRQFAEPGADPRDPDAAALAAARYLKYALNLYDGDVGAALAEYNGGPRVARAYLASGDPGNKETRDYIRRVLPAVGQQTSKASPVDYASLGALAPAAYDVVPVKFEPKLDADIDTSIDLQQGDMDNRIAAIVDEVLNA